MPMDDARPGGGRWRFTLWDLMTCVAGATVLLASVLARESPLLPLLGFFVLTQLALRILIAAMPLLEPFLLGSRGAEAGPEMDDAALRDAVRSILRLCHERQCGRALERLDRLGAYRTRDPSLAVMRAWCLVQLGRIAQAVEAVEACCTLNPDEPVLYYTLACYQSRAGRIPAALRALSIALEIDAGFRELLADEPDFEPIRGEVDFERLARGPRAPT